MSKTENVNFQINADIIKKMKLLNLPMDQAGSIIFVINALGERKHKILDAFDDENREKRVMSLYRDLERKEIIEKADEGDSSYYILTNKGLDLVEFCKEHTEDAVQPLNYVVAEVNPERVEDWIADYLKLFPAGKIEGKTLRMSSAECIPRMKEFMRKYPYEKDVILSATRLYMKEENGGGQLTRNSKYFIEKYDKEKGYLSDLLAYCERVAHEQENPEVKINTNVI